MLVLGQKYRLSRFFHIRLAESGLVVESLLSGRSHPVPNPSFLRLLLSMTEAVRLGDLLGQLDETQKCLILRFLSQCYESKLLTKIEENGKGLEEDHGSLGHWEFHDLLFHVRSRRGRNPWPVGASYHLRGKMEPEPAFKDRETTGVIPLARPDLERLSADDLPLTAALERRRSLYSTLPIDLVDLGEFLFRTCRIASVETLAEGEVLPKKVYPSGGSLHSLEVYVVAWKCCGLNPGGYHYLAREHLLAPVCDLTQDVEELLREAQVATGRLPDYPPVLLIFSARFRRVSLKYESITYHLILQEVGALYQTLYLVATSMGLAPCALGAGDSDRFAVVFKTDYYSETSVGEFILGGLER